MCIRTGGATVLWAQATNGFCSGYLVELNASGAPSWRKSLGNGCSVTLDRTSDGGSILGLALFDSAGTAMKVDAAGSLQWVREYGQPAVWPYNSLVRSIREAPDGGYVLGCYAGNLAPDDFWIARTDDLGQLDAPCRVTRPINWQANDDSLPPTVAITIVPQADTFVVSPTSATSQAYTVASGECLNADDDNRPSTSDNCPLIPNQDQGDNDLDGRGNVCDNCPSASNATQVNQDGDTFGDACDSCPLDAQNDADADGRCADVDNCPATNNPTQPSADGDGAGDACDCQPSDPSDRQPAEVHPVSFTRSGATATQVNWTTNAGDDSYAVWRGAISALGPDAYGSCTALGLLTTTWLDASVPAAGQGYFYLVQAQNGACGAGPLGYTSAELPRTNGGSPPLCP